MAAEFNREQSPATLDEVGAAAIAAGTRLDIAVYGGSALMLAGNFRFHKAIEILRRYFPKRATHADAQRFVLKYLLSEGNHRMRPATLAEAVERVSSGEARDTALAEYLDTFYLAPSPGQRFATLADEPALTGDVQLDALAGAIADYL
jgi:hypothetical protein